MRVGADKKGLITVGGRDPRITRTGYLIRKYKLDELPQLFNVLKGDMSLVGPRPERPFFVEKFREEIPRYMVKHQVRPGLTGWAQVNGRKEVPWSERIELNVWYAKHMSLWLDLKIFSMTIFEVATNANNENISETGVKK